MNRSNEALGFLQAIEKNRIEIIIKEEKGKNVLSK